MSRLDGVEDAKLVLKPAHMDVRMKAGYWPDLPRMEDTIKRAGYTPVREQVRLVLSGKVVRSGDALRFEPDGMKTALSLPVTAAAGEGEIAAELARRTGETIRLEALWSAPTGSGTEAGSLQATAITPAHE